MKKMIIAAALTASVAGFAQAASADQEQGKAVFQASCVGCHGTGAAGSPKVGDKAAWAPRIGKGIDLLMESARNGVPGTAMMARGTCGACTDDDLRAAIEYMISLSQ